MAWRSVLQLTASCCRPIKMLRLVVATFFVVFYIGSLAVFMVAANCQWFDQDPKVAFHLRAFPDISEAMQIAGPRVA